MIRQAAFQASGGAHSEVEVLSELAADRIKPDRMHFVNGAFNLF